MFMKVAMFVKCANVKDLTASWSTYIFNLDNTVNGTGSSIQYSIFSFYVIKSIPKYILIYIAYFILVLIDNIHINIKLSFIFI